MPENHNEINEADLIWIEEAATRFMRSRDWLQKQASNGLLKKYTKPGDRRVYLSINEIKALLKPKEANHNNEG